MLRPDALGAALNLLRAVGVQGAQTLQFRALQRGRTGSALVDDGEAVAVQQRAQSFSERSGRGDTALPRPARQRHQQRRALRIGALRGDLERQLALRAASLVERDAQAAAHELSVGSAGPCIECRRRCRQHGSRKARRQRRERRDDAAGH